MARASLVRRTRWQMVAVATLSVAVVFVVFYLAWTTFTTSLRTDELARQTLVIASGLEAAGGADTAAGEELRARLFRIEAGLIGATLATTDDEGAVLLSSRGAEDEGTAWPVDRLGEPDDDGVRSARADLPDVGRVLMVAAPIEDADAHYVVAIQPLREVNSTRGGVALLLALSAAAAVGVAWAAGGWSARRLTGPILRLEEASEAITGGDWGHQAAVEGDDEVAHLAEAFNRMSARVAAAYDAQVEFVGNVSHEMRTPITSIAGFAGALADGTVTDEPTRERYLRLVHDEAERLGELASVLLELANLDAGLVEPVTGPVRMDAVGETLLERHRAAAAVREIDLDVGGLSGSLRTDDRLITQALSTLVENAVRYTPHGSRVRVSTETIGAVARLVVEDSGPGIPPERRDDIFDRFVRLESSRAKEAGGSGLGLAICRRMVEVLDGRVWVEQSDLGGARFVIEVPQAASDST